MKSMIKTVKVLIDCEHILEIVLTLFHHGIWLSCYTVEVWFMQLIMYGS